MMEFIKVHDAAKTTNPLMLLKKDNIFKIEETVVNNKSCRLITFTDHCYEFVTESMDELLSILVTNRILNS